MLLKSVTQSIPTYMTSLFPIPAGILDDINSMCARFWRGARVGYREGNPLGELGETLFTQIIWKDGIL